jgi:hypothetical protein
MIVLFPKKLVRFYRKKFGDKIIFKSLLVGLGVRSQETGDRRQETGDYFYLFSLLPTPHTPHPTPYTPHPTPHTPHPTPLTPHPLY